MKTTNSKLWAGVVCISAVLVGASLLILEDRESQSEVEMPVTQTPPSESPPAQNDEQGDELAYIDEVVRTLSAWDRDRLKPLLAPQTLAGSSDAQLDQVLGTLGSRLGALRSYDPPAPEQRTAAPGEPENLSAYRLIAYYDKGMADLSLVLQQDAGTRHLYSFNVEIPQQL